MCNKRKAAANNPYQQGRGLYLIFGFFWRKTCINFSRSQRAAASLLSDRPPARARASTNT